MDREDQRGQKVEEAAVLLIETVDSLQRRSSNQIAPAARESLAILTPHLEEAIKELEHIEQHRDLTDRELSQRHAFKMLLAAT